MTAEERSGKRSPAARVVRIARAASSYLSDFIYTKFYCFRC